MTTLTESRMNNFTNKMALILRDACVSAGMNDNDIWNLMGCYHRELMNNNNFIHSFLVGNDN